MHKDRKRKSIKKIGFLGQALILDFIDLEIALEILLPNQKQKLQDINMELAVVYQIA